MSIGPNSAISSFCLFFNILIYAPPPLTLQKSTINSTMPGSTQISHSEPKTPSRSKTQRKEADTPRKNEYFGAIKTRGSKTKKEICKELGILPVTARSWERKRRISGEDSARKTRRLSTRLGRKPRVSDEELGLLLDPKRNPVRDQRYEAQIKHHGLRISPRQLRVNFSKRTKNAQLFRKRVLKKLTPNQLGQRNEYSDVHEEHTVDNYFQFVHWTDEAHGNPLAEPTGRILREEGTAYDQENMQAKSDLEGCTIHVAASVSWWHKSDLIFYNDENDETAAQVKIQKTRKPRKRQREDEEMYQQRLAEWEASLPHDVEVKKKGNSMTQRYYTDKILPVYLREIEKQRALGRRAILQEDNDPSYGTIPNKRAKVPNIPTQFKNSHHIETLKHPSSSPDLNPKEGIWNILFQRVRREVYRTQDEYKQALRRVWSKITRRQIRRRIAEMPYRCKRLKETGGQRIRTKLW